MVPNPKSVLASSSLSNVLKTMQKEKVSHIIVSNEDEKMRGVISKEDLLQRLKSILGNSSGVMYINKELSSIKAEDIMTKDFVSIKKDDPVEYGIELLLQKKFHCLPVVENNKAVGIVTFYDLLKGYYEEYSI